MKGGEEVKRINVTLHGIERIELFIFEGILGPFYESGGLSPSQQLIAIEADREGIGR